MALLFGIGLGSLWGRGARAGGGPPPPRPDPGAAELRAANASLAREVESLRQAKELAEVLLNSIPDIAFLKNAESRFQIVNQACAHACGVSREAVVGKTDCDFFPPEIADRYRADDHRMLRTGEGRIVVEEPIQGPDGTLRWIETIKTLLRDGSGASVGIAGTARDITERKQAEEALRVSEVKFRAIFMEAAAGVALLDMEGSVREANPALERMLGYSQEELLGRPVSFYTHPEDTARQPLLLKDFREGRRSHCTLDRRYIRKDGSVIWVHLTVSVVHGPQGAPELLLVLAEDITERRQVEEALRVSEERFELLSLATNDAVWDWDIGTGRLWWNEVFPRLFGGSVPHIGAWEDRIHPDDRARMGAGLEVALHGSRQLWMDEYRFRRADGTYAFVLDRGYVIRDENGSPVRMIGAVMDLTGRREAEEALRASEERYRFLFEGGNDAVFVYALEEGGGPTPFREVNGVACQWLGYSREELLRLSPLDFSDPEDPEGCRSFLAKLLRDGHAMMEGGLVARDGTRIPVEASARVLDRGGERVVISVFRDITERKQAEEALQESQKQLLQAQKMEAVGRLAGGVAHDFNNMLTAISGFTHLLHLEMGGEEPAREYLEEIIRATDRSTDLTRQLLAFSRQQVLQPKRLDLNVVVGDMDRMLRRLIREDIDLVTVLEPSLGCVLADPGQMQQVVLNLAVNARDAMPSGGRLVIETRNVEVGPEEVRRRSYLRPGSYVSLVVHDTGAGMSPEFQERIWEPFFTTKEVGKGTGLGLSTVYGIVKQSGGYIWVESTRGRGSCFRILLPRVAQEPDSGAEGRTSGKITRGAGTVLLVEDEPSVRRLARKVLLRCGYQVVEAECGIEAIHIFEEHSFDLLLTDMVMPRMSGMELGERLLARTPSLRVLYMSGYTDDAAVQHGTLPPGTNFIPKPFTPEELAQKVREVLQRG
ncbi:MAG TPA: PAS domain S-box protein [Longimicrobiaceae bacterium]|nr:PAS domain S-box protein [Longimicrobiaceae bacterium]